MQKCKLAYGLCKGAKVGVKLQVAGGSLRWQVAGVVLGRAVIAIAAVCLELGLSALAQPWLTGPVSPTLAA